VGAELDRQARQGILRGEQGLRVVGEAGRAGGGGWLGGLAILVATEETIQVGRGGVVFRLQRRRRLLARYEAPERPAGLPAWPASVWPRGAPARRAAGRAWWLARGAGWHLDIEEAAIEHQPAGGDGPADGALVHAEAPGKGCRRFEEAAGLGFHFSLSSFQEKIE
jgi:hypothetical protein